MIACAILLFTLLGGFVGYNYGHEQCCQEQHIAGLEYRLHELELRNDQ
jgi:hypothetical protein